MNIYKKLKQRKSTISAIVKNSNKSKNIVVTKNLDQAKKDGDMLYKGSVCPLNHEGGIRYVSNGKCIYCCNSGSNRDPSSSDLRTKIEDRIAEKLLRDEWGEL